MNSELLIIFPSIIVMLIVIGASVNGIISKATAYYLEKDERQHARSKGTANVGELGERNQMIEDRLAVLERLATDKGTLLSDEIEALRLDVSERREKENS
ncbi:MAG: hypothetical protein ABJ205_15280 [Erythrobacter sp.]|uniref:hypothetical protein n=1 Tax=Erythrobacter sp. TaxID=1042 RepID=UPI0032641B55